MVESASMDSRSEQEYLYLLNEAEAEINRHHRDFLRIRQALDDLAPEEAVKAIRNIVG